MRKILFSIFSILITPLSSIFAQGDMTTVGFTIPLNELDPLIGSKSGSSATGIDSLFYLLEAFSRLLLMMIPVIAIVSVLIAGYYYIFSAWDAEKAGRAKTIIKWNIIAIIIALLSWSIIQFIASIFST